MNSPIRLSNTRRNLFGTRINTDQLKTELTTIWKDQCERQKRNWNFDFELLKPVTVSGDNFSVCQSPIRQIRRFEWTQVQVSARKKEFGIASSYLESNKRFESDDDEEDDGELVVPQFYQQQRVAKMKKEVERLKQVRMDVVAKIQKQMAADVVITKTDVNISKSIKKVKKQVDGGLIITLSENRKDTLRSAKVGKRVMSKKDVQVDSRQPKISGMLKQRKRRQGGDDNDNGPVKY